MDIKEKAKMYAEGKALNAITSAIEEAYAQGYRDGYKDGYAKNEEAKPEDNLWGVNYVDLELPSGKKWSTMYLIDETKKTFECKLFTYDEAIRLNIPTIEDFQELLANCRIVSNTDSYGNLTGQSKIVGRNGNYIYLIDASYKSGPDNKAYKSFLFWLKNTDTEGDSRICADGRNKNRIGTIFMGFKLPIMLVK